ncbi:cytochrome c oxidase subunit 3 [soil metagenome]
MDFVMNEPTKKIHPHKFTLWIAIGSIVMMFAGLTSAYIVKRNQPNWITFDLPLVFWYSTAIMLASSITIYFSQRSLKEKNMRAYRRFLIITTVLGMAFILLQIIGFLQLRDAGFTLTKNVSISFLYIIVGLHAVHVLGGVMALWIMFFKAFSTKRKLYSAVPIDMMSTYWHFVDGLWIYLLVFLLMIR